MKEIKSTELKEIELNILRYVDYLCENNNLKYYLAYGTLIGAIRHNGFIPWDDDIDIFMPREDYYKLIDIMACDNGSNYELLSVETNPNFTAPLPKIVDKRTILFQDYGFIEKVNLGVYIDIFILDGVGNDMDEAIKRYDYAMSLYRKWSMADRKLISPRQSFLHNIKMGFFSLPYKVVGIHSYLKKIKDYSEQISFYDSYYVGKLNFCDVFKKRSIWLKEDFGSGIRWNFESCSFLVPSNYDTVLRKYYGDYMKLPPKEKQISHHYFNAYYKE